MKTTLSGYLLAVGAIVLSMANLQAEITLDTTYNPALPAPVSNGSGYAFILQTPDGQHYLENSDSGTVLRLGGTGAVDTGFNPPLSTHLTGNGSGFVTLHPEAGGTLLAGGIFAQGGQDTLLMRLQASGSPVPGHAPVRAPRPGIYNVWVTPTRNGAHHVVNYGGYDQTLFQEFQGVLVASATTGQITAGFPPPGTHELFEQDQNGRFIAIGYPLVAGGQNRSIARYLESLLPDNTFNAPVFNDTGSSLLLSLQDWNTHYYLAANFTPGTVTLSGQPARHLYRLLANGTPDPAFTPYLAPSLNGTNPEEVTLEEVSDALPQDEELLVSAKYYSGGAGGPTQTVSFNILDAGTGAVNSGFNPQVKVGLSSFVHGEFTSTHEVGIGIQEAYDVVVNGQAAPAGASSAIFSKAGNLLRYEMDLHPFPLFEGPNELTQELETVGYIDRIQLEDGSQVVYGTYPPFTRVNGQPAQGLIFVRPDGTWDQSAVVVPEYPSGTFWYGRMINVTGTAPGELLLTGNFTSINGIPRPGTARLLLTSTGPPQWTDTYGLSNDPAALSQTDSDGDGVPDLVELAFGLHPRQPDGRSLAPGGSSGLPVPQGAGTPAAPVLELRYIRRRDRVSLGLTYEALFSSTLTGPWTAGTEITQQVVDGTWEVVTVRDTTAPAGAVRRYGRVRVGL